MINALILSCLDVLPKIVTKSLKSIHKLLFGLFILSQIWKLFTELIETIDKLIDHFLLLARSLEELNKGPLALIQTINYSLILFLDLGQSNKSISEVVTLHLLPEFDLVLSGVLNLLVSF